MSEHSSVGAEVWKGNQLASAYLRDVRGGIPFGAEQIAIALRVATQLVPDATSILDLGSGDGVVGQAAMAAFPGAALTLLDFSPAMLEAAVRRFEGQPDVRVIGADFGDPGWIEALGADFTVDIVISAYAIHHQEDPRKHALYREIFRLLNPGGMFLNIEHVSSPTAAIARINDELFVDTLTAHQHARGSTATRDEIAQEFYFRPDKAANRLAPVGTQLEWLREIGFSDVDCYFKVLELAVFGGRKGERTA